MIYFKKILILFLSLQSVGSNLSMSYNIELIIFENKNVETKEIFEKEYKVDFEKNKLDEKKRRKMMEKKGLKNMKVHFFN